MIMNNFLIVDGKLCPKRWWVLLNYTLDVIAIARHNSDVSLDTPYIKDTLMLARYARQVPGDIGEDKIDLDVQRVVMLTSPAEAELWKLMYERAPDQIEILSNIPEIMGLNESLYDLANFILTYHTTKRQGYLTLPDDCQCGIGLLRFYTKGKRLFVGVAGRGELYLHRVILTREYAVVVDPEPEITINTINVEERRYQAAYGVSSIELRV